MIKTRKFAISLILTALLLSMPLISIAAIEPDVEAQAALLVEVTSDTILYSKNRAERRPPDSLTKLLTVYIAADMCAQGLADKEETVTMTQSAWDGVTAKSSTQDITPGEEMTLLELMYCAYLGSSNEACNMIAEHLAGSAEDFITLMNNYVQKLGCTNTLFTTTHGQYDPNQYTTAWDQYLIYSAALKNPLFFEIDGIYRFTVDQTNMSGARKLTNPNHMLNSDSKYYYRFCSGGRPSATLEGGYSFVGSAGKDSSQLISVILGSDTIILEDESSLMRNLSEAKRLFEWGLNEFGWRTVLAESELVAKAPVTYGDGADYVNLRPQTSISLFLATSISDEEFMRDVSVYSVDKGERLYAPIEAGEVLGEISVTRGGTSYGVVKLIANTSVDLHRIEYIRSHVKGILGSAAARTIFAVLIVLLIVYIALVVRYNKRRREHLRRVARTKERLAEERRKAYRR